MDITNFIVSQREKALLIGDYGSYRKQLSRRLLVVRRKLKYTSTKGRKYAARDPVRAEDIAKNHEFVHLLLLLSERAWAQAMHMKATHSADSSIKGITGSTKSHIRSRLHKASVYAGRLVELLKDKDASEVTRQDLLEARAFYISLRGANSFEKESWENCLHDYSEARLIYTTLALTRGTMHEDLLGGLLNSTIDPSIRYAAYKLNCSRTTSIETIVSRYVQRRNNEFVQEILEQHPESLDDPATAQRKTSSSTTEDVPKSIRWRSREVSLEDAATAQALAVVSMAESNLSSFLSSNPDGSSQAKASAYDEVLIPSQDAVDATKTAIDELSADGVTQSDRRIQALQITRTAVNYALVGWRIGRNRILCGEQDGALFENEAVKPKKARKDGKTSAIQEESTGRKLATLKGRVVLYDATLQSLDSVKGLPGVAADQKFVEELDAKQAYFAALRCLAMARSYGLLQDVRSALALLFRAFDLSTKALNHASSSEAGSEKPPNLDVTWTQAKALQKLLQSLVFQYRALVELRNLDSAGSNKVNADIEPPLVERLDEYPHGPVDLKNLVTYPPQIEPIPVKPLFLDVAFNYIDYPASTRNVPGKAVNDIPDGAAGKEEKKKGKKGWFGFGR